MDISRLKKRDLEVWLLLMDSVEILCRHITQGDYDDICKQATATRFHPKTHMRMEERDEEKFLSLLGRAVVKDWRGLTDGSDEFPCVPENIDYMMKECTDFRLLIMTAPLSLEKMLAAEREATRKNSLTTSEPSSTSRS